jgi:hypothetical protein
MPRQIGTGRTLLFAPSTAAPITFETAGTAYQAAGTSHAIVAPSGIVDGNLLVCIFTHTSTPTITPPGSWDDESGFNFVVVAGITIRVYTKIASGESGNYTFSTSVSSTVRAQIYRLSGADTADRIGAIGTAATGSGTTATATAITAETTGLLIGVVAISGTRDFSSAVMTETADSDSTAFYYQNLSATGDTGTRAFTISSSAAWGCVLFEVRD